MERRESRVEATEDMTSNQLLSILAERGVSIPQDCYSKKGAGKGKQRSRTHTGLSLAPLTDPDDSDAASIATSERSTSRGRRRYSSYAAAATSQWYGCGRGQARGAPRTGANLNRTLDESIAFNEAENERHDLARIKAGPEAELPLPSLWWCAVCYKGHHNTTLLACVACKETNPNPLPTITSTNQGGAAARAGSAPKRVAFILPEGPTSLEQATDYLDSILKVPANKHFKAAIAAALMPTAPQETAVFAITDLTATEVMPSTATAPGTPTAADLGQSTNGKATTPADQEEDDDLIFTALHVQLDSQNNMPPQHQSTMIINNLRTRIAAQKSKPPTTPAAARIAVPTVDHLTHLFTAAKEAEQAVENIPAREALFEAQQEAHKTRYDEHMIQF